MMHSIINQFVAVPQQFMVMEVVKQQSTSKQQDTVPSYVD
jgi:hypothetical protein